MPCVFLSLGLSSYHPLHQKSTPFCTRRTWSSSPDCSRHLSLDIVPALFCSHSREDFFLLCGPLMPSLCLALSMSSHLLVVCLWSSSPPEKSLEPWNHTSPCFLPRVPVHSSTHIWVECYHFGFQLLDHCEFWWQGPKQSGQRGKPTLESDWLALLLPAPWLGASSIATQNLSFFFYTLYVFRKNVFRFKKISEVDEVGF